MGDYPVDIEEFHPSVSSLVMYWDMEVVVPVPILNMNKTKNISLILFTLIIKNKLIEIGKRKRQPRVLHSMVLAKVNLVNSFFVQQASTEHVFYIYHCLWNMFLVLF